MTGTSIAEISIPDDYSSGECENEDESYEEENEQPVYSRFVSIPSGRELSRGSHG